MAGINDRDRLGSAGGTPTRYTINRSRSSSRANPTQIDILEIDDSKARKTLQDFFTESRRETKSAADDIRKMWTMSIGYSDDYRKQAIANINKLEDEREAAHKAEVRRINIEYRNKSDRDKALAQEMKQYNLDRIKYIKEINAADRQGMEVMRKTEELRKKYSGTRLGRKIQEDLDRSLDLKVKLQAEYDRVNSGKLSQDELIEVAENTDRLEEQLDIINGRIGDTISKSEKRTEGMKSAIKQFIIDVVSIFGKDYWEGIQKNFNAFENIYTDISGRMQTSYSDTKNILSVAASKITGSLNSAINIADDLYPALQNAVHQGFTGNGAISKAIADAEAKIIMPWLDTATDAWVNMSFNMTEDNMKLLKSQQLLLQTSKSGNRLLQSGVINSMTSEMEPLLRDIDFNTGGAANMSAEAQAIMAGWVSQGMTPQEAFEQMQKMISVQKDQYGALTSGDVTKVLMGSVADQGYKAMAESVMPLYEMAASGGNLEASALNDILGLNLSAGTAEIAKEWVGGVKDSADYMYDASVEIWDTLVENIDEYITQTAKQRNEANNLTARNSQWLNDIPHGMEVLESVKNLVVTAGEIWIGKKAVDYVGSKLLGGAAGKAGIGSSGGATNFAEAFGDTADDAARAVADASDDATRAVTDIADDATSAIADNVDDAVRAVSDTTDDAVRAVTDVTDDATRAVADVADDATRAVSDVADDGVRAVKDVAKLSWKNRITGALAEAGPDILTGMWNSSFVSDWFFHNTELGRALNSEYGNGGILDLFNSEGRERIWKEGVTDPLNDWAASQIESERAHEAGETFYIGIDHIGDAFTELGRLAYDVGLDTDWTRTAKGSKTQREKLNDYQQKQRDEAENAARIERINTENEQILSSTEPIPLYPDLPSYNEFMGWSIADKNKYFEEHGLGYYGFGSYIDENGKYVKNGKYFIPTTPINGGLYQMPEGWVDPNATYFSAAPPSYAIGSPYITKDQLAFVHEGERILTPEQNESFGEIGSTGLLLAGSTLINKLLGFSNLDADDDISREDMTDTLVESLDRVTAAISGLSQGNGIDYNNRTLPRITNNYNSNLVNLSPTITASR